MLDGLQVGLFVAGEDMYIVLVKFSDIWDSRYMFYILSPAPKLAQGPRCNRSALWISLWRYLGPNTLIRMNPLLIVERVERWSSYDSTF
jgi:hypothetical protein